MSPSERAVQKPLHWVGSAKRDLLMFPDAVVDDFGYALGLADARLIRERLRCARADYEVRYGQKT